MNNLNAFRQFCDELRRPSTIYSEWRNDGVGWDYRTIENLNIVVDSDPVANDTVFADLNV